MKLFALLMFCLIITSCATRSDQTHRKSVDEVRLERVMAR